MTRTTYTPEEQAKREAAGRLLATPWGQGFCANLMRHEPLAANPFKTDTFAWSEWRRGHDGCDAFRWHASKANRRTN